MPADPDSCLNPFNFSRSGFLHPVPSNESRREDQWKLISCANYFRLMICTRGKNYVHSDMYIGTAEKCILTLSKLIQCPRSEFLQQ